MATVLPTSVPASEDLIIYYKRRKRAAPALCCLMLAHGVNEGLMGASKCPSAIDSEDFCAFRAGVRYLHMVVPACAAVYFGAWSVAFLCKPNELADLSLERWRADFLMINTVGMTLESILKVGDCGLLWWFWHCSIVQAGSYLLMSLLLGTYPWHVGELMLSPFAACTTYLLAMRTAGLAPSSTVVLHMGAGGSMVPQITCLLMLACLAIWKLSGALGRMPEKDLEERSFQPVVTSQQPSPGPVSEAWSKHSALPGVPQQKHRKVLSGTPAHATKESFTRDECRGVDESPPTDHLAFCKPTRSFEIEHVGGDRSKMSEGLSSSLSCTAPGYDEATAQQSSRSSPRTPAVTTTRRCDGEDASRSAAALAHVGALNTSTS
eukprot:TRINITY_DN11828_c0_g2_i2.p1 TRINITY_DN11828_c0_g2~~TRINITY_DN11828_c0_g2_i2.p1  ORF type:complete len:378 (+),score=38.58 TRINITY_DN11828_c0_g2_i2:57-1190(+)